MLRVFVLFRGPSISFSCAIISEIVQLQQLNYRFRMFQRILVSTTEWNELLSRIILVKLYFQWEYILINEWDCKMSTRLKSNDGQGLYQQFRWNEQGKLNILYPEFLEGTIFSDQFSWRIRVGTPTVLDIQPISGSIWSGTSRFKVVILGVPERDGDRDCNR